MATRSKNKIRKPRVADDIMAGMRELERMMNQGKTPQQMFAVKTVAMPDSSTSRARQIRAPRAT